MPEKRDCGVLTTLQHVSPGTLRVLAHVFLSCMHAYVHTCVLFSISIPISMHIRSEHGFPGCRSDLVYCPKNLEEHCMKNPCVVSVCACVQGSV